MANILSAIMNFVSNPILELTTANIGSNRINSQGDALETYIKYLFANVDVSNDDSDTCIHKLSETFSYLGNKNNPPDCILREQEALEIKKLEGYGDVALNSSYPKQKLYSNNPLITESCRQCENWDEKEMLYVIGNVYKNSKNLQSLYFIYGNDYCANKDVYERKFNAIKEQVITTPNINFTNTDELGKVREVDPLGITVFRIRGMWHIKHPAKVFDYIYHLNIQNKFTLVCLINEEKYNLFPNKNEFEEYVQGSNLQIETVDIQNPDNPSSLRRSKLITFTIEE